MKGAWIVVMLLCLGQGLFAIPSALADGSTMDLRPWGHVDTPGTALDVFVDADHRYQPAGGAPRDRAL